MPEKSSIFKPGDELGHEMLASALADRLAEMTARLKAGPPEHLDSFTFMLQHEGHPLRLDKFFSFLPMFQSVRPYRMVFKTGRQVAKTTSACASNTINRMLRPDTKALIVTPLFGQVHRISTEIAGPMVARGLFRDEILENTAQQVLKRRYSNGSVDHYSYAFMSAGRIRSISGIDDIWLDEVQDIRTEFIPVIEQTSAGRAMPGRKLYSGTPLSMANTIQLLWEESSQAVEAIKCDHCGFWNLGCVDQHLIRMIGKHSCTCAKCDRILDVMAKVYIPRYPEREEDFQGCHISQVLHPLHAMIPSKWHELRRNMENYTTAQFHNEVLGESYDSADRMIDLDSLRNACTLGPNTMEEALRLRDKLELAAIGVDWTGGGDGQSLTKVVFGGLERGSSTVKVLFMFALPPSMPIQSQIPEILRLVSMFRPDIFAHDYSGHGWLFETLGLNLDLDNRLIWPFEYGLSPNREVIYSNESKTGLRKSLHLDHTRSLFALYSMIKAGRVLFPDWKGQTNPDSGGRPCDDFMHMYAESHPGLRSGEILYVRKDHGHSDDFVHATNFMASACWYAMGSYPTIPGKSKRGARLQVDAFEAAELEGEWLDGNRPPPPAGA